MKELTHEEWMKNPTPRVMWVWDNDESNRKKMRVIYISEYDVKYPVTVLCDNGEGTHVYMYCAEIEKTRRMTNKELSWWLREKPTREYNYKNIDDYIYGYYEYKESCGDEEVPEDIRIREDDGEWREPLVEDNNNDND